MNDALVPVLSEENFFEFVDNCMHEMGIHCGIPPGIGEAHITTTFGPLAGLLNSLNPATREEQEYVYIVDDIGGTWISYRRWVTSRQWKGKLGLVWVLQNEQTGKFRKIFVPQVPHLRRWQYLGATLARLSNYLIIEAEQRAQCRLFEALTENQCNIYLATGTVVERGRSGVVYMIRKNRPTIAVRILRAEDGKEVENILCTLCLHPVGYYTESWAGITPPSDEVLAHLLYIRSDEAFYWRKANQISPDAENSGI